MKKRLMALSLILTMMLSYCMIACANVTIPISSQSESFGSYTRKTALQLKSGQTLAHYFKTTKPLKQYSVTCPSWNDNIGALTISIYKWSSSYENTISTTPIATQTYTNFNDGAELTVSILGGKYSGSFLAVFSNPTQTVGVWRTDDVYSDVTSNIYINGTLYKNEAFVSNIKTGEEVSVADVVRNSRDAYSRIQGEDFDGKSSEIYASTGSLYVQYPNTVAGYADVNFGTSTPLGINVRVNPVNLAGGDTGEIHVMLDHPENGTRIAEVYFEYSDMNASWLTIPASISTKVSGLHDIYFVFLGGDYYVDWFQFSKTAVGKSTYQERLDNFVPVDDSDLLNVNSDTWSATDMLGRKLPGYETVGQKDEDKKVGIFYHTWHAAPHLALTANKPNNNQQTIKNYLRTHEGGTVEDIKNAMSWDGGASNWGNGIYVWNESIYGYYHGLDAWVIRKQMELLSAAGVDVTIFDASNGNSTFTGGYMLLGKIMHEMRQNGIEAPKMAFLLQFNSNSNTAKALQRIYQSMYGTGLYSDCWYYWNGKPLVMAYPEYLKEDTGYADINALNQEILNAFTFRPAQASYFNGPTRDDHWPWLEVYPQHGFVPVTGGKYDYECVAVGTAQNANDNGLTAMNGEGVYGRSYTYKDKHALLNEDSKYYGYNFQEQWDRALELNPQMIFVTGWNEYTVGHNTQLLGVKGAFVDAWNDEYSRDIEPSKGEMGDIYYYQMVANIRRFKGVNPTPVASAEKTINLGGGFTQWNAVGPEFIGYKGGTEDRNIYSVGKKYLYYNDTGRNDIVLSKVARDANYIYFYVQTAENITSYTDPSWMRLFINTDRSYKTGWEGYDFVINRTTPNSSTSAVLEHSNNGWDWEVVGNVSYKISKNQMMIRVPRDMLGLTNKTVDIEFKWNDNMQAQGDIMDFYNNGDTAPVGRYAYRYTETTANDKTPVDEPVTVSQLKDSKFHGSVIMKINSNDALVDGIAATIDTDSSVVPQIINEKTMVPVRFLSQNLNANVEWNENTQTATISRGLKVVEIKVGQNTMKVNGETVSLQSPATVIGGRIFVPMRDIGEALGKQILWIDTGLIIAGDNPETVHGFEWVGDRIEDTYGLGIR
ncbi:MAG: hypothetical protein IJC89_05315 [Clostridia bacterium]|nr:hypothetical protein [Clostridia bacterium]